MLLKAETAFQRSPFKDMLRVFLNQLYSSAFGKNQNSRDTKMWSHGVQYLLVFCISHEVTV